MKSKPGSWIANCVLVVAAVTVTLFGFEIALRILLPQKLYRFPRGLFRSDPDTVFSLQPNFEGASPQAPPRRGPSNSGIRGFLRLGIQCF